MNIYSYLDYKQFLKSALGEKKRHVNTSFTYARMAKACGIQKTYLSRVLNSDSSHLSEEQLFLCANYLGITKEEHHFLQLLRSYQKSSSQKFRATLEEEIGRIRKLSERTDRYLVAEKTYVTTDLSSYYLDPHVFLVHIFLSVERFRKDLKLIAKQLHLSEEYLADILTKLEQMQLISLTPTGYVLLKENTHLGVDSPLYAPFRLMQRLKALERIQRLSQERTYNFSAVFSADESLRAEIKSKFLELLGWIEKRAHEAPDEEVYQLNIDLFDWSLA